MDNNKRSAEYFPENNYDPETLEQIRLAKIRRQKADQLAKDRLHAEMFLIGMALLILTIIVLLIVRAGKKKQQQAEFLNSTISAQNNADTDYLGDEEDDLYYSGKTVPEYQGNDSKSTDGDKQLYTGQAEGHSMVTKDGITYVDGIMIVNKTFSLPADYNPGIDSAAQTAFNSMAAAAWGDGISLWICSGFRSYSEQEQLFDSYATQRGLAEADDVSARPGHSEHQSGLCMDINSTDFSFAGTAEAQWLAAHCEEYGFIIRFPEGKEDITGYAYEPWHIRYVGYEAAQAMKATGQCLEEYLGVTSDYNDSPENQKFIDKYSGGGSVVTTAPETAPPATDYQQDQNYDYGNNGGYSDYNTDWNGQNYDYNYDYNYDQNYDYGGETYY